MELMWSHVGNMKRIFLYGIIYRDRIIGIDEESGDMKVFSLL